MLRINCASVLAEGPAWAWYSTWCICLITGNINKKQFRAPA